MSKEVEWSRTHGECEIVCTCVRCGEEVRIEFKDGHPDFKAAQAALKSIGWVSRKINNDWYDFCSEQCYYDYIKENK